MKDLHIIQLLNEVTTSRGMEDALVIHLHRLAEKGVSYIALCAEREAFERWEQEEEEE